MLCEQVLWIALDLLLLKLVGTLQCSVRSLP